MTFLGGFCWGLNESSPSWNLWHVSRYWVVTISSWPAWKQRKLAGENSRRSLRIKVRACHWNMILYNHVDQHLGCVRSMYKGILVTGRRGQSRMFYFLQIWIANIFTINKSLIAAILQNKTINKNEKIKINLDLPLTYNKQLRKCCAINENTKQGNLKSLFRSGPWAIELRRAHFLPTSHFFVRNI